MSSTLSSLRSGSRKRPKWVDAVAYWFRPYELVTGDDTRAGKTPQFRYLPNAIEVWGTLAAFLLLVHWLAPRFWASQVAGGSWVFAATLAALLFFAVGPGEWFFHRFSLHGLLLFRAMPWLKIRPETGGQLRRLATRFSNTLTISITYYVAKMAFGHGAHHKITDVTPINPDRLAEFVRVRNRYEITENDQTEHAVFPHFSVVLFWLGFAPLFLVIQLIANGITGGLHVARLPILLAGAVAMAWQVWAYENSHAIMHKPYAAWWKPRIQGRLLGWWYDAIYRFHFFHHMNEKCSLGIVGAVWFCYIWDRAFGTYKLAPASLIEAASQVNPEVLEMSQAELKALPEARQADFDAPRAPRRWVAFLDEQTVVAQGMWNKLFIAALIEVRRRNAIQASDSHASNEAQAARETSQMVHRSI
ncbi:MAG: hypothetical protein P4L33_10835 [Capsulimonadaceae bacterium]|nr:hypothetical protein [Capsulimonadaceae bacterium]